jgi:tetratricopeptide (TPR) repeat protein
MNLNLVVLVLTLAAPALPAQRVKFTLNTSTPEGVLLAAAGQETDPAKQIALYSDFVAKFPKHEGVSWACGQLAPLLLKAGQFDRAMQTAETGLAADALNAPLSYNGLQGAEGKKDPALIKAWSARTVDTAQKVLGTKKPEDSGEAEEWAREVDFATQVIERADYALYAAALLATDAKAAIDLGEALEKRNPKSQYMPMIAVPYFRALLQSGLTDRAVALAAMVAEAGKANEEMLIVLGNATLSRQEYDKALQHSAELVEMANAPAPAGADPAAWEKRKTTLLGRAQWTAGFAHGALEHWTESEAAMRAALPLIATEQDLLPAAHFYLGVALFRQGSGPKPDKVKLAEARKYFQLCAATPSAFQETAKKNLAAMGRTK